MNATAIQETESVTRTIARWGSAVAAVVFGVAFITDKHLSLQIVSLQLVPIALIVAIFAGYALAWTKRYEAVGSVIALLSVIGAYVAYKLLNPPAVTPFFLGVGLPALFHLVAVVLHRMGLTRAKA